MMHCDHPSTCALSAPLGCTPSPVVRPCGRCGHAHAEHDPVFGGAGCMSHLVRPTAAPCACSRWVAPEREAVASTLRTDATCLDACLCRDHHPLGAAYYVSCRRNCCEPEFRLLLGPFPSHGVALGFVDDARRAAENVDPNAVWYAYGTVAVPGSTNVPGPLNARVLM